MGLMTIYLFSTWLINSWKAEQGEYMNKIERLQADLSKAEADFKVASAALVVAKDAVFIMTWALSLVVAVALV